MIKSVYEFKTGGITTLDISLESLSALADMFCSEVKCFEHLWLKESWGIIVRLL